MKEFQFVVSLKLAERDKRSMPLPTLVMLRQLGNHIDIKVTSLRRHSAKILIATVSYFTVAMVKDVRRH